MKASILNDLCSHSPLEPILQVSHEQKDVRDAGVFWALDKNSTERGFTMLMFSRPPRILEILLANMHCGPRTRIPLYIHSSSTSHCRGYLYR